MLQLLPYIYTIVYAAMMLLVTVLSSLQVARGKPAELRQPPSLTKAVAVFVCGMLLTAPMFYVAYVFWRLHH